MRRSALFLAPITLGLLAVFACEDTSSGDFGSINLDAGKLDVVTPTPTPVGDAAAEDAGADADAAVGPNVTVAVTGSATARMGVEVVFHDAAGAVLESKVTGADGIATISGATMPAMATALLHAGSEYSVVTWTGLAVGDRLVVHGLENGQPVRVGTYNVTGQVGANPEIQLEASSACSTSTPTLPVALDVYPACISGPTGSVLAYGNSSGIQTFAFAKNVTPTLAGAAAPLGPFTNAASATITATGFDPQTYVSVSLAELSAGVSFHRRGDALDATGARSFPIASGFADALQATMTVGFSRVRRGQMKRSATTPITFDLGAQLPALGSTTYSGDLNRPTLTWSGDTATTTGGAAQFSYRGNDDASFRWTFIVPPGTTSVKMPALPTDAVAFAPTGVESFDDYGFFPEVVFVASTIVTPAALRAGAAAFGDIAGDGILSTLIDAPAPVDGLVRFTALEQDTAH